MLKAKSFAKKTRTGKVVQVTREHYLRDDIFCGLRACRVCQHTAPVLRRGDVLIPDTNVVLHQVRCFVPAAGGGGGALLTPRMHACSWMCWSTRPSPTSWCCRRCSRR